MMALQKFRFKDLFPKRKAMIKSLFLLIILINNPAFSIEADEYLTRLSRNSVYKMVKLHGFTELNHHTENIIWKTINQGEISESEFKSLTKDELSFVEAVVGHHLKTNTFPPDIKSSFCSHSKESFKCVELERVYDGDTIFVNIEDVHPIIGKEVSVRLRGVDAPEIRTKDQCEKELAIISRNFVEKELLGASIISLTQVSRDKYFRLLATVNYDGKDLGKELLNHGLAYPYLGNAKPKINWCERLNMLSASLKLTDREK